MNGNVKNIHAITGPIFDEFEMEFSFPIYIPVQPDIALLFFQKSIM